MIRQRIIAAGIGIMVTPVSKKNEHARTFSVCAFDTGLFGKYGTTLFNLSIYERWLDRLPRHNALFATAPDVFGDGEATLRLSLDVLPRIRTMGFPAAFVAQPGVPEYPWDEFDVLFMGGPDEFKQTEGQELLREAKKRGKWCHIGRVNSTKRYLWAREQGYDSADGTHIAFCPSINTKRVLSWVTAAEQLTLEMHGERGAS